MKLKKKYYPSEDSALSYIKSLKESKNLQGKKVCIIGCGCMGKIILYWLNFIFTNLKITIIDLNNKELEFSRKYFPDVQCINIKVTKYNYKKIFNFLKKGDIVIDASYDICTISLYKLLNDREILYINSAVEIWNWESEENPYDSSIYKRHKDIIEYSEKNIKNTNFLVSMGCNPGNVSLWTKYGLYLLAKKKNIKFDENKAESEIFPFLSQKLGVQVIHICEHDAQLINNPRKKGEYVNTWSSNPNAFYEELLGPTEISWGTHEKNIPNNVFFKNDGVILISEFGVNNLMRTYTPKTGMFFGFTPSHDESLTIGKYLTVSSNNKIIYKPSCYYIYKPTNACLEGIQEIRENNFKWGEKRRFLTKEIVEGSDELGLSLFLKNGEVWWIGSLLDIEAARRLHPEWMHDYINATNTQVLGGYLTGIFYLLDLWDRGEKRGLLFAEDIPLEYLKISLAFQGKFVLEKAKWDNDKMPFEFGQKPKQKSWMFEDFRVKL